MTERAQFKLVRSRLALCFQHEFDGKNWANMAAHLRELTGAHIPHETLRQTIKPVSLRRGIEPRMPKDSARIEALAAYAVQTGYLTQSELEGQVPLGLLP